MGLWILMFRRAVQISVLSALLILLPWNGLAIAQDPAAAQTMAIIAGTSFPKDQLTMKELKAIYLGETQLLKDLWIHPIDQRENRPIRKSFLELVVHMSRERYIDYWNRRLFRQGGFSPMLKSTGREVIEAVRERDGGVGYVWLEEARNQPGIKILLSIDSP
jgi:ABC-type phosphate transport system substrate-binding protein